MGDFSFLGITALILLTFLGTSDETYPLWEISYNCFYVCSPLLKGFLCVSPWEQEGSAVRD
jgi:hypothetical protein